MPLQPTALPPVPARASGPMISTGLTDPQIQDQQFAGALKARGMPIPFSELSANAGANLTPPVTGGIPSQHLPEWQPSSKMGAGSADQGHKKALLQKLMGNLLTKPGRSMHEIINGVKDAISAYKNYSKEWDTLNGMGGTASPTSGASSGGIQSILRGIQQKKAGADGAGGPGLPAQMTNVIPPLPQMGHVPQQAPLIAGQAQQSSFNRPAPVSSLGVYGF